MCGIAGILNGAGSARPLIEQLAHRGPNGIRVESGQGWSVGHARLSIIDLEGGWQPLHAAGSTIIGNGEIYNYKELYASLKQPYKPVTGSDCEAVIPLYQQLGIHDFPNMLRGMFSFVIYDRRDKSYYAVRDHVGITPLYLGYGTDGSVWIASEMKALATDCATFQPFLPGHYYSSKDGGKMVKWYNPNWGQQIIPKNKSKDGPY
jgi:asparagine synthase (glutamine-hydrolysing)